MQNDVTLVTIEEAMQFLVGFYHKQVSNVEELSGGKHSWAFSYACSDKNYVVRFNTDDRGFLKDQYVWQLFCNKDVPIPQVYSVGIMKNNIYYCISEKILGETIKQQYSVGDYSSLPVQFETIEKIKDIGIPAKHFGFGEWEPSGAGLEPSFNEYVKSIYSTKKLVDWDELGRLPYFDRGFVDYLIEKMNYYIQYSPNVRELLHGDFGNDNLFINSNKISGVIDWERSLYGDHFLDVGRVVLFCPSREATVAAATEFYRNSGHTNYKERIALGVYFAMLRNYGLAAQGGNEASCINSPKRIKEFEFLMKLSV